MLHLVYRLCLVGACIVYIYDDDDNNNILIQLNHYYNYNHTTITTGHQPMNTMDTVGLVIIMSGLVVYRFTNTLTELWYSITGFTLSEDERKAAARAREILQRTESEQTKYVGINQIEGLNALFDTRVMTAQKKYLQRNSQQIRGSFLARLGIPPSPLLELSPVIGGNRKSPGKRYSASNASGSSGMGASPLMSNGSPSGGSTGSGGGIGAVGVTSFQPLQRRWSEAEKKNMYR